MFKIIILTTFVMSALCAVHYRHDFKFQKDLDNWYHELHNHDRMPETYVRFLAFKKLIRDFNPIQEEMLQASLEAEHEKNYGIKEMILAMGYDTNREIEKRLSIHQPFIDMMRRRI